MSAKTFLLSLALLSFCLSLTNAITCEDPSGKNVDYWTILKYPNKTQMNPQENNRYAYYDSSVTGNTFKLRDQYVDVDGEPLERLVVALNQKFKSLNLIAWNDGFFSSTSNKAHSKGIIAYDESTDQAVYLVHSVPDFPAVNNNQFDTIIPENNRIYGQSFLCMSLDGAALETIADGLLLENIEIYHQDFSSSKLKKTSALAAGNNIKNPSSDVINFKTAVKGLSVTGFFKNAYDTSITIYEDVIVPGLKTSLFVESWGRPYMASDCSLSGGRFTKNILSIKVAGDSYGIWENTQDHSKWAISASNSLPFVCLGDMNRQSSQSKRGGGAFCIKNAGMWAAFNSIIDQFEDCSSTRSFLE